MKKPFGACCWGRLLPLLLLAIGVVTTVAANVRGQLPVATTATAKPLRKLASRTPLMGYGGTPDSGRFPLGKEN